MLKNAEDASAAKADLIKSQQKLIKSKNVEENEECQTCLPGFHMGRIHSIGFEYKVH